MVNVTVVNPLRSSDPLRWKLSLSSFAPSSTIFSLKKAAASWADCAVHQFRLVDDEDLEPSGVCSLEEYGYDKRDYVTFRMVFLKHLPMRCSFPIFVKFNNGRSRVYAAKAEWPMKLLLKLIEERESIRPGSMAMIAIHMAKRMEEHKTLRENMVERNSLIRVRAYPKWKKN